ncbi:MAG: hypothetical protein AMJ54_07540 [Deltaproteobacteria bacterium SG8_13]|nr:MAG: hypothetical protein AMJ54_07540 [Deltaproteobacteria bacterium SG8_13]
MLHQGGDLQGKQPGRKVRQVKQAIEHNGLGMAVDGKNDTDNTDDQVAEYGNQRGPALIPMNVVANSV